MRQPSSFNRDVSFMNTGLDGALSDNGMEYLFNRL